MPVILKKRPRSTRRLPRTNSNPKTKAAARPASTPSRVASAPLVSDSADRNSTVSMPSRKTIRKVKRKIPAATAAARSRVRMRASVPFISPERALLCRHIQTSTEPTTAAAAR